MRPSKALLSWVPESRCQVWGLCVPRFNPGPDVEQALGNSLAQEWKVFRPQHCGPSQPILGAGVVDMGGLGLAWTPAGVPCSPRLV